ncbi:MAG: glyoxalase/bleomycin resistance/dioxygenase family protein, partial [Longispora sp.]|nr:glyoxalase/bleomycin resistance/dioxygenase family protein [Longispora sp. (in: high G+C Gram-positive bacteria)]
RLTDAGLVTLTEDDTTCCYALQDKVWVRGPGKEPWEVYVVKADAPGEAITDIPDQMQESGCCTPAATKTPVTAGAASGCY